MMWRSSSAFKNFTFFPAIASSSSDSSPRKEASNQATKRLSVDSSLSTPKETKSPLRKEEEKKKPSTTSSTDSDLTHDFFDRKVQEKKAEPEVEKKKPVTSFVPATADAFASSTSSGSELDIPDKSRKPVSPSKPAAVTSTHSIEKSSPNQEAENNQWYVKVHTSDLKGDSFEGTDAKVHISLIGTLGESEKIALNKTNSKGTNKDLFEKGHADEFVITTTKKFGKLTKIRIGHDGSGLGSAWHLNKVEVMNQTTGETSVFACNRWLAKDEDDGLIERVLGKCQMCFIFK